MTRELALFSALGFAIGGLSDLALDLIWIVRGLWRRATIYSRYPRTTMATLAPPKTPGRIAIFIAAWDESAVIGNMLRNAVRVWGDCAEWRIYLGVYPNDPATRSAAQAVASDRLRIVIGPRDGPTTKADCLNSLYRALLADERRENIRAKAIMLHDAEDVVHRDELRVIDLMIERFDLVQLPVLPLVNARSRWVAGSYADEFAESHGKTLSVREALGAGLPSAGVGTGISRAALSRLADHRRGYPFAPDSLTEDYEMGLAISAMGGRSAFVRLADATGQPVAVRAHFPDRLDDAVRQKTRWIVGIALAGWDRIGWHGRFAERWMRLQDRRAIASAFVLTTGYGAALLAFATNLAHLTLGTAPIAEPIGVLRALLTFCAFMLIWRLAVRAIMVGRIYGWREGCRAIPRVVISNIIAIMASWRAVLLYARMRRDQHVTWDKTAHAFPENLGVE